jgi:hypothetical protein
MKYFFICNHNKESKEIDEETFKNFLKRTNNGRKIDEMDILSKKGAKGFIIKFIKNCPECSKHSPFWHGDFGVLWPDGSNKGQRIKIKSP